MDLSPAPAHAFTHTFAVALTDIDALGHANNVAYVRWVQEAAAAHWQQLYPAGPDEAAAQVWVVQQHLVRYFPKPGGRYRLGCDEVQQHLVRYFRPAYAADELRATTWVADVRGAGSQRLTRLERARDGQLLCAAETQWVLVDAGSGRPVRVPADVAGRLLPV